MLSSSAGEVGTRLTIILRPSVEPIPIEANDRIEVASEINFPDPASLKMNELVRPMAAGRFTCVCWEMRWAEWSGAIIASICGCRAVVMVGLDTAMGSMGDVLRHPLDLSEVNAKEREENCIRNK